MQVSLHTLHDLSPAGKPNVFRPLSPLESRLKGIVFSSLFPFLHDLLLQAMPKRDLQ